uniref:Soluble lytic murein transglycosylase (EC) n=1 Tax=uncultured Thiotrichaceae bacterium TaxID=298394 RepID=A0A6S6U8K3_9GAMM|nr:MAG: Soluble lytic murein transglycosylase precursor (EC [uncultured Thiotrichaceae bacterium]
MKQFQSQSNFPKRPVWFSAPLLGAALLVFGASVGAEESASRLEQQRKSFLQAEAYIEDDELDKVKPLLPALKNYPLYPWLEYEFLLKNIDKKADHELLDFVERYPNSVMSDRVYLRWAQRLKRMNDWSALLKFMPEDHELTSLQCLRAEAHLVSGETQAGLEQGKRIWAEASGALPERCDSLVLKLQNKGVLSASDYWQRIEQLIPGNHITAAKTLAKNLSEDDRDLVDLWAQVRKNPKSGLKKAFKRENSDKLRQIIVFGIKRAADKKLSTAKPLWVTAQSKFSFTQAEHGDVESTIGMWEAWRHSEDGLQRLKNIPAEHRSDTGNVWMARMALRTGQWQVLADAVEAMGEDEAKRDIWQYWKARALSELGKKAPANSLFTGLAGNTTFYGFLAADRLGEPYAKLKAPLPDRGLRIAGLKKTAAVKRWQEWMALGNTARARKEWFRTLKAMDKDGMLAAAELATQEGDANLAIWTVSRTKDWNIVDLRFPVLYSDLVQENARSQGVQPEWILGVMRRESAFNADAESHVKALGLMQLMPATARDVGRKLGMKVSGKEEILQPSTNVQLGSAYLSSMLGRFDGDYARATAAYNAGPHRIPKWAPDETIAADQWVESIPFKETRRYVRAVMAYTTIYDHKLNAEKGGRLSNRLKPIRQE